MGKGREGLDVFFFLFVFCGGEGWVLWKWFVEFFWVFFLVYREVFKVKDCKIG